MRRLLTLLCLLLALPVLTVLAAWLSFDAAALAVLRHQAETVLPGYVAQSLGLAAGVALGVVLLGVASAVAVAMFAFPGRALFEWALLLPLAMPGYVLAYAYTDALQFSGPLQVALRAAFGWQGALWPDVRSLWGAVLLFVLCLYPYVYLLTRAALAEAAAQPLEAARLLGAGLVRRIRDVALPLVRPAIVAGTALALMETLADYGVGSYFGLSTFTTGIYRAWLSMNDATAAAQLASMLLVAVALLLAAERQAQSRMRFAGSRHGQSAAGELRAITLPGAARWALTFGCALPVLLGFVLPTAWLCVMLWREAMGNLAGLPLARFAQWAWSSFQLAAMAAAMATLLALAVGFALRLPRRGPAEGGGRLFRLGVRVLQLGYAVPGAVVALGILLPVAWLQAHWPASGIAALFTGTLAGLLFAYLVRFSAVALQSVESGYTRLPRSMDETSRVLGAGRLRLFFGVHLPLLSRSAWTAALLVFVDTMKELPATLLLRPFGSDTLAVVGYNLARDERLAEAALPSLAIVAVGLLPVVLLSRTIGRRRAEARAPAVPATRPAAAYL
ncbi:ABC transporter permease [Aquabacterium sp. OR-4]|uniref:ABC transporter permease n=1 Tax=Aquabacterium sp. OR-4 TaxID=2978127 RepID=UPI0021B43D41|nr:iron ABC transporter permease [Aquabacterium sp. OR-4]MDT7835913.1 iron ABC transporter permease [Aquabacterium sp. OR-4]